MISGCDLEEVLDLARPAPIKSVSDAAQSPAATELPALLSKLGERVGGLDAQVAAIVRRTLASRVFSSVLAKDLGLPPVRSSLSSTPLPPTLYGKRQSLRRFKLTGQVEGNLCEVCYHSGTSPSEFARKELPRKSARHSLSGSGSFAAPGP